MSVVNPIVTSKGEPIKLNYAAGATNGTSDPVKMSIRISVNPNDEVPQVVVKLVLDPGHFTFGNGSFELEVNKGNLADDELTEMDFTINCDIVNPGNIMAMRVFARDEFDTPTPFFPVTYSVEKKNSVFGG